MPKVTVKSPSNIAFIKYWGRADHEKFIPRNTSNSMNLDACYTITTAEFIEGAKGSDEVEVKFEGKDYKKLDDSTQKQKAMFEEIERLRQLSGKNGVIKVRSANNFPADAGIASSASGFSALVSAVILALGMDHLFNDKNELSRQVRMCGSSSGVRSVLDGFVELVTDGTHEGTVAVQIASPEHWALADIVAIVDDGKKLVSSSEGHKIADTSPYFEARIREMQSRISLSKQAIISRDLRVLGPIMEQDSTSMHAVMMTSNPPAFYWTAGTLAVMQEVMKWRREDGLQAYFTNDAGANVHIICEEKDAAEVEKRLQSVELVKRIITNKPAKGTHIIDEHLF